MVHLSPNEQHTTLNYILHYISLPPFPFTSLELNKENAVWRSVLLPGILQSKHGALEKDVVALPSPCLTHISLSECGMLVKSSYAGSGLEATPGVCPCGHLGQAACCPSLTMGDEDPKVPVWFQQMLPLHRMPPFLPAPTSSFPCQNLPLVEIFAKSHM